MNSPLKPKAPESERVEPAPTADHGRIEGAPAPILDVSKHTLVTAPSKKLAEAPKELKWYWVQMDLGPSCPSIRINDVTFHHGEIARAREDMLPVLNEVMFNTKQHERVVKGEVSPIGRLLQHTR